MNHRLGIVVEFVGLPGSGKSTVARAVEGVLQGAGWVVHNAFTHWNRGRGARLANHATSSMAALRWNPGLLIAAGALAGNPFAAGARTRFGLAVHWLNRCGHLESGRRVPGVHLIDQGVFQVYASLAFAGVDRRWLHALTRLERVRSHADLVVVVRAAPEVVARRLASRPGVTSRLERALDQNDASPGHARGGGAPVVHDPNVALARAQAAIEDVLARARSGKGAVRPEFVEVRNDADDQGREAARLVARSIAGLLDPVERRRAVRAAARL